VTGSCSTNPGDFESIGPNGENVPRPLLGSLPNFLQNSQAHPGSGVTGGARIGYDLNDRWQIEFTYDYNAVPIEYRASDLNALRPGIALFCDPNQFNTCDDHRNIAITDHSHNRGHQNMYLFNVNYHWNTDRRFVPYIGAGAGAEDWSAGSSVLILQTKPGGNCGPQTSNPDCRISFFKKSEGEMGFAMDFAAGAKYYFSPRWGLRFEVRDVLSWADFKHRFESIDIDGDDSTLAPGSQIPPTGVSKQENGTLNQLHINGGLFFRF
jgi:opacity protein-like surface antigen